MDIPNLQKKIPILVTYMRNIGYTAQYIWYVKKEVAWIVDQSVDYNWKTYADIEYTLSELWTNKHTFANKSRLLRLIQRYDEGSKMPDGLKHHQKPSHYDLLCDEFKKLVDTIYNPDEYITRFSVTIRCALSSFLLDLQEQSLSSLVSISEMSVQKVFSPNGIPIKSYAFKYYVEYGLRKCCSYYEDGLVDRIISYLPAIPNRKKNIQYLTGNEIKAIKSTLECDMSISLQDKAIAYIAMYTGLRSCDIAALTTHSFDWEKDLIIITQSKTGNPLTLPLRAIVGNTVYDYLKKERPKSAEPYIFLTVNSPYRRLHSSNLNAICVKIMHKAGIRLNSSDRKGFHLFRHYVATSLLQSGVQQPIISATLGHSSPESLNPYLNAEFSRLKECALSISNFPMRKEVFE